VYVYITYNTIILIFLAGMLSFFKYLRVFDVYFNENLFIYLLLVTLLQLCQQYTTQYTTPIRKLLLERDKVT